jgi:hypothetical protein
LQTPSVRLWIPGSLASLGPRNDDTTFPKFVV